MGIKHSITGWQMNTFWYIVLLILILSIKVNGSSQVYPSERQLIFEAVPRIPRPGYLQPVADPTYGSVIIRITDKAVFDSIKPGLRPFHHYPKNQPWNSDGSLILLDGWPGAVLDGNTYKFVRYVDPPTEPHGWSNTKPHIVYGTNKPNLLVKLDVSTNITQTIKVFSEYSYISYGDQEGSPSNDDRYISLICKKPSNEIDIVVYDLVKNEVVAKMDIPEWPNNCTVSQSGKYVLVQYMTDSTGPKQGLCAYNLKDLSFIRNIMALSIHYDVGYDTGGNEVVVCSDRDHNSRAVVMTRIDNGKKTTLLSAEKMSWPMHISCRNIKRPGYAYLSDFAESYSEPDKPNFQKIFALKLDPAANGDALTETFSNEWHSDVVEEDRCPFGVPNRDGSKVMFRSDWMNGTGEINSYVTFMPYSQELPMSERMAKTVMTIWADSMSLEEQPAYWTYQQGFVLMGIESVWKHTGDKKYFNYIKQSMDDFVNEDGTVRQYASDEYNLDHIMPGRNLLFLYNQTGEEKYLKAVQLFRSQLTIQPRTKEGGFWHQGRYPYQMWLDGLYMASPFYAEYAKQFNEPQAFDDIANQFIWMEKHAKDEKTGLLYHGWDESKKEKWADPVTGCSPNFWGRSMGWYIMALVEVLDYFPAGHPKRAELIDILNRTCMALVKVQDEKTRLWYQVLNMADKKGNYLEASASCMYVYTFAKAVRMKYLDPGYLKAAQKAYDGILYYFVAKDIMGYTNLNWVCRVAGLGDDPYRDGSFEYYINERIITNDPKGVGAFLLAAVEMENLSDKP